MGARRADWVNKTSELLRPGMEYFQVVFTIPQALSSLVLGNRKELYRLLFRSAAESLHRSIAEQCGMQSASTMVLHTWNQRLGHHPHVHALVPGSGPSLCGTRWIPCRYTKGSRRKPARPFLVDNKELGRKFRDLYTRGVKRLIKAGVLQTEDLTAVNRILSEVETCDWVVYIQPPPQASSDPADIVKYLARYMTGGPISDRRLIKVQDDRVYFWARSEDKSGKMVEVSQTINSFISNWTLHILPKGFTKARCYGGWSNRRREAYQQQCDRLQPAGPVTDALQSDRSAADVPPPVDAVRKCPQCETPLELESSERRPSWRELFYGPDHPQWARWIGSG
jgi:hypothetical protein